MTEHPQLSTKQRVEAARKRYEEMVKQRGGPISLHTVPESKLNGGGDSQDMIVQLRQENQNLVEQVKELNLTVEQQKVTIKKLRNEATELKLDRMDLDDRIAELEEQVSQFKAQPQIQTQSEVKNTHSVSTQEKSDNVVDFKEKLMSWKDWQVDMRTWNTATKAEV